MTQTIDHFEIVSRAQFDAAIFDLDGVLTDTARVHAAAWKHVFDDFLGRHCARRGTPFTPFDTQADYLAYVDGRSREDGVRHFLASRGIRIPERTDKPGEHSVHSLAVWKDDLVQHGLREASETLPGAAATLQALQRAGLRSHRVQKRV